MTDKAVFLRIVVPDTAAAMEMGNPAPKFSDRLNYYKQKGVPNARKLAEREHLIAVSESKKGAKHRKAIGIILGSEARIKHTGGFEVPYTLE